MKYAFQWLMSFFWSVQIEHIETKKNGRVEVCLESGRRVLNTENANQSYGNLHKVFQIVFDDLAITDRSVKSVLALGFAGGSIASILLNELVIDCQITAVEHDDKLIALAKKHFEIYKHEKLKVVCNDALEFISKTDHEFDLIVVDLFKDDEVPKDFQSTDFIKSVISRLSKNGLLYYNMIADTEMKNKQYQNVKDIFNETEYSFQEIKLLNINRVLVLEK